MSSLSASSQGNIKRVMRTALVGIKPADQVMLKGYLRVLLRLEADLEWVSANHPHVDLFMINNDFKSATNVQKLLESQVNKPVLYIDQTRNPTGDGDLYSNLLSLPLKKMHVLNDWLMSRVSVLNNSLETETSANVTTDVLKAPSKNDNIPQSTGSTDKNRDYTEEQSSSTPKDSTGQVSSTTITASDNDSQITTSNTNSVSQQSLQPEPVASEHTKLISIVETLHKTEQGIHQLSVNGQVLAVFDLDRSLIWQDDTQSTVESHKLQDWQITVTEEKPAFNAKDMKQWLWDLSWESLSEVLPLIDENKTYQLRYWVKPNENQERRNLLKVMTAMESQALNIKQISEISETELSVVKEVVAGLLFSGYLKPFCYEGLNLKVAASTEKQMSGQDLEGQTQPDIDKKTQQTPAERNASPLDSVLSRRAAGEAPSTQPSSTIPSSLTTNSTSQTEAVSSSPKKQEKKMGFLSRLRRKLGL